MDGSPIAMLGGRWGKPLLLLGRGFPVPQTQNISLHVIEQHLGVYKISQAGVALNYTADFH